MRRRESALRHLSARAGTLLLIASAAVALQTGTAHADDENPEGQPCIWYDPAPSMVISAGWQPVITHYAAFTIADGTAGERTDTLSITNTVTTTVAGSAEISNAGNAILKKVGVKVGFSVQTTKSTTSTESTTMRWSFNKPGHYGLFRGTRAATGIAQTYWCNGFFGTWARDARVVYTTYGYMETGTVSCAEPAPDWHDYTVRAQARRELDC
ncbi:hypothetical protein [Actinosynnema sp. NPDC020468]|uniref:hypothetical protein n=1 Tax=Actinosynnema sp. NPDC020468 TaxID=3154488 RepID=UPI0033F5ADAE